MTAQLSAKDVARYVGTSATTLRKYLRSADSIVPPVGKGKRYSFTEDQLEPLKQSFEEWAGFKPKKKEVYLPVLDQLVQETTNPSYVEVDTSTKHSNGRSFLPVEEVDEMEELEEFIEVFIDDEEVAWLEELEEFEEL